MKQATLGAFLITYFIVPPTFAQTQADSCLALIPKNGAYQTFSGTGASAKFDSSKEWFCSDDFVSSGSKSNTGASVVVPVYGVPVGASFNSNDESAMQSRTQFCADSSKQFSDTESQALYVQSGDSTLVKAFLDCESAQGARKSFLHVTQNPHEDGTFDVHVSALTYPGSPPTLVAVTLSSGAHPISDHGLASGASIPFEGSGRTPLVGIYQFDDDKNTATIVVSTTIGDDVLHVARCPSGRVGSYTVSQWVSTSAAQNDGTFDDHWTAPQASCHPHCGMGVFEPRDHDFADQSGDDLVNVTQHPEERAEAALDHASISRPDNKTIRLTVFTHTIPIVWYVHADKMKTVETSANSVVGSGNIDYGKSFYVEVDSSKQPTLALETDEGNALLTSNDLSAGSFPPWLASTIAPQIKGTDVIYNLRVQRPECQ